MATLLTAPRAQALPAFARKYGTSCLTCHTVYPKLTPFGEAFRRNGYRFPGIDSDYVKQETVPLGQEANKKTFPNSVWPATLPISVPLAFGVNGQGLVIPSKSNTLGQGSNGANFTLQDLVAEGHIWAGAALSDTITLWGELTFSDGGAEVEHAQVLFNDLVGPKHLVNLVVGHGFPTITPFGSHSSFLADQLVTTVPVTGIYGVSDDPWTLVDNYTGVELNGVVAGRVEYGVGLSAGKVVSGINFPTENVYGHLGLKLGGMRLDGEGTSGAPDPLHPWAETALTLYGFAYQSNSHFNSLVAPEGSPPANDLNRTLGLGARGQLESAELNFGFYHDRHNHGTDTGDPVTARVVFGELSYILFPWLVPAVRIENVWLDQVDGSTVSDLHVMPGLALLVRPNIKVIAVGNLESSSGFPSTGIGSGQPTLVPWQGGAGDWVPMLSGPAGGGGLEFESIAFFVAWAL